MAKRMTQVSKENLLKADSVKIEPVKNQELFFVRVGLNGNYAYLSDSTGPIEYKTVSVAVRTIKRIRPDLKPTTI